MGHAVGILCDTNAADALTETRLQALRSKLNLGIARIPMNREIGPLDVSAYVAARHATWLCDVDVLHGHGAKGGAYARLVTRSLRRSGRTVRCYYTPHGGSLHYPPRSLRGRIYAALERRLSGSTDGIIFESAYAARTFIMQIGFPACRSRVIRNGLLSGELKLRALNADAADFLFVGELRHLKGVDTLLDALFLVRKVLPATVVVVGDGPDVQLLRQRARDLGLAEAVRFMRATPAHQAFTLGRCLIVPSRAESLPYIVLEAAAAGVPLIATRVGGIPEIVAGSDTPLVPPDNPAALSTVMLNAMTHPEMAEAKAARLRSGVADRFSATAMTRSILDFYGSAQG